LNSDVGGLADKEVLSALVGKYKAYACMKPLKIKARVAATKVNATLSGGPQTFANLDTTMGFQCLKSMQSDGSDCLDYEVQLCCPGKFLLIFLMSSLTAEHETEFQLSAPTHILFSIFIL
jgi:hypothetical protein